MRVADCRSPASLSLLLAFVIGSSAVSGCNQHDFNGLQAGSDPRKAQQFHVVAASTEAAVVSALGKEVAIRPASGFCLSRESIETSSRSAVALIGDCAFEADADTAKRGSRGELALPRSTPGIITITISGDPTGDQAGLDTDAIEAFLQSPQGRGLIGRTSNGSQVKVRESRRKDGAVYVLVEDKTAGPIPLLSDTFWRAFMTVKDRLAVITISGFRANPLGVERMLGHLSDQVVAMQDANRGGLEATRRLIATATPLEAERVASAETGGVALDATEATRLGDLEPTSIILSTTGTGGAANTGTGGSDEKPAQDSTTVAATTKPSEPTATPEPEIRIEPSTTLPVSKTSVPKARPDAPVPKTRTATLQNPSTVGGNSEAPKTSPIAPKRKKRS